MDYEEICEDFIRACSRMVDEKKIKALYELLKDFSEDELANECELCVGEAIRARSIIWQVGEFLKATGEEKKDIREDILVAVDDFYNY